jgi:hypothetical protein
MAYLLTQRAFCNSLRDDRRPYNGGLIKPLATGPSIMVKNQRRHCRCRKIVTQHVSTNFDLVVRILYCDRFFCYEPLGYYK